MKLIIDSGSTKADWCLTSCGKMLKTIKTEGINPFFQSEKNIREIINPAIVQLKKTVGHTEHSVQDYKKKTSYKKFLEVIFYGAGVRDEMKSKIKNILLQSLAYNNLNDSNLTLETESDLLAAARALCQHSEGIACILGTGANSCLYDGKEITNNTPSLGYILGDEGSGAVLGRNFLNALYKNRLDNSIKEDFENEYNMTVANVIERVYRQPMPNRFLASLSTFIGKHSQNEKIDSMLVEHFRQFFRNNITQYCRPDLPVNFIGSIAFCYKEHLINAAKMEKFEIGKIEKSPMNGLVKFHN